MRFDPGDSIAEKTHQSESKHETKLPVCQLLHCNFRVLQALQLLAVLTCLLTCNLESLCIAPWRPRYFSYLLHCSFSSLEDLHNDESHNIYYFNLTMIMMM